MTLSPQIVLISLMTGHHRIFLTTVMAVRNSTVSRFGASIVPLLIAAPSSLGFWASSGLKSWKAEVLEALRINRWSERWPGTPNHFELPAAPDEPHPKTSDTRAEHLSHNTVASQPQGSKPVSALKPKNQTPKH